MSKLTLDDLEFLIRDLRRKWGGSLFKLLIALLFCIVGAWFYTTGIGQKLDLTLQQPFYTFRGVRSPPPEVILVAIDDTTYSTLQAPTSFPLPRKYTAEALEQIIKAAPKLVIFDGRFEPLPGVAPEADDRIEAALQALPATIWSGKEAEDPNDPATKVVFASDNRFRNAAKAELPMSVAGMYGELCFVAWGTPEQTPEERAPIANALVDIGHTPIKGIPGELDFINFYGPHLTIPRMSLSELITGNVDAAINKLRGKIVLIGYQSRNFGKGPGNSDRFPVPVSTFPMYGVEVHATIVNNLIDGSWLKRASPEVEILSVALFIFIMVSYALRFPNWKSLTIIIAASFIVLLTTYILFAKYNIWLGGVGATLLATILTVVISGFYFIIARDRFERIAERKLGFRVGDE
jgi:adenylate cyclase